MKPLIYLIAMLAILRLPSPAQQTADNATAYRASVSQAQLQASTARMKAELAEIMRQYEHYEIAAMEVAMLKESVGSLDQLTARDMPAVAQLLLDSSHAADPTVARASLSQANGSQKDIQTRLRTLADQLALYTDQAAMQKRIEDLAVRQAANLRGTRDLSVRLVRRVLTVEQVEQQLAARPPDADDREAARIQAIGADFNRRKLEQAALEQESRLAVEALAKVAADPLAAAATHFTHALEAAATGKLTERAQQASSEMTANLSHAGVKQQEVFTTLQAMIASLDAAQSDEDRLREIATQLAGLADQETGLANRTPRMWGEQKTRATQDQLGIGDRLEVLQNRLKSLNPETATKAVEAASKAGEIGTQLQTEGFTDNIPLITQAADSQQELAKDLAAMSAALQQQADQLAGLNTQGGAPEAMPMSPEAAAIQAAMQDLVEARINVELAGRQSTNHADFKPRLAQGQQDLADGTKKAREAGPIVGEEVHKALAEADRLAQLAAKDQLVDHHLYHTRARINDALAGLQDAANELAAQQAGEGTDGQGEGIKSTPSPKGGPVYSNLAAASDAQRDALTLLKQEKTAPDFIPMVNQYIKNLAEEQSAEP
jgi:hypothetical protein